MFILKNKIAYQNFFGRKGRRQVLNVGAYESYPEQTKYVTGVYSILFLQIYRKMIALPKEMR